MNLANDLIDLEFNIWYDEFTLKVGDSLRQSVDKGLSKSRYGIVVLSPAYLAKDWPQYELNGLVACEIEEGWKVILPIWHNVDKPAILDYSQALADKIALVTTQHSILELSKRLATVLDEQGE
jgi:ADP-heptose:LPS heptosyltransferase